jgi:uncharacterized protein YkwD
MIYIAELSNSSKGIAMIHNQTNHRSWIMGVINVLAVGLLILLGSAAPARAYLGCGGEVIGVVDGNFEQQLAVLVNQARQEVGLPPLKLVEGLSFAARYHAADLGVEDYFQHDTFDRSTSDLDWVCAWWQRVEAYYPSFDALGENIAAGASTPEMAMELWMNSDGHRANILDTGFREIGIGYARADSAYQHYWVQDFSAGASYPLVIEGELAITDSPEVQVYLYGAFSEMRLRVDDGAWSDWMPFQNSFTWQLPAYSGDHSLSAEMRSPNLSAAAQDSIYLDYVDASPYPGPLPEPEPEPYCPSHFIYLPLTIQQ